MMHTARIPVYTLLLLMIPRPPRSTLVPYTTLCRSGESGPDMDNILVLLAIGPRAYGEVMAAAVHELRPQHDVITVAPDRSDEHTSELQSRQYLVCRLLLEKKNKSL